MALCREKAEAVWKDHENHISKLPKKCLVSMKARLGTCRNKERTGSVAAVGSRDPNRRSVINMNISRLLLLQFPQWEGKISAQCVCKQNSRGPGWICLVLAGLLHWSASSL